MVSCAKSGGRPAPHRYKGVEGLLRRIAFNLGNSPSQTEVKIISCIPIDVTDLQQKIICLEKQLEAAQCRNNRSNAAVFPLMVDRTPLRVAYPSSVASAGPGANAKKPYNQETASQSSDARKNEPRVIVARDLSSYLKDCQATNRTIFENQIPEKDRTKLVYYAQTATGNPFTNYKKLTSKNHYKMSGTIDPTYLKSIINRQYRSGGMYIDDEGLGSQLSAPICRDMPRCATTSDDMCSCCQGHFLDVDREQHKRPCYTANIDSSNIYYDSSFYDMKPVKEEPNTSKRSDLPKRRGPEIDLAFYPEYYRFNPAEYLSSNPRSKSVKFPKKKERLPKPVFIQNDSSQTDGLVEFSRVYTRPLSPGPLENSIDKSMSRTAECNARSEINAVSYMGPSKLIQTLSLAKFPSTSVTLNKLTSKNADSVDRNTNETKCLAPTTRALQTMSLSKLGSNTIHKVTFKNAEVLALGLNETECQTDPPKYSESTSPPQPDKTESTLDQIKSILQTVLTEVKTNSRMRPTVEPKETKDAVVQNESPSSPDCERLLGSFTYSGFPINNPYVPSCSGGVPTYCSSVMRQTLAMPPRGMSPDMNCVQNFPVFVQRTLATQHTCCSDRGQAKQTSTNTLHGPPPKKRTTETENLIKEIYKSMALNVDDPIKTTSREVVDEATSARKTVQSESVGANTMTLGREEIIYRGNVGTSRFTTRMLTCPSSQSSLSMRRHRRSDSFHQPLRHITSSAQRRQFNVLEARSRPVEDSPESASDSETEVAAVVQPSVSPKSPPAPTTTKKGFFGKVMSSVIKRMRRKEGLPQNPEKRMDAIAEDSDSEFETIHQKADKPVKHVSYAPAHHSPWKNIMHSANTAARPSTSKNRRLLGKQARSERGRLDERPARQSPRVPKYVPPRSAMRPHVATSQVRRAIHRPNAPHRPRTPPEYMRRVPHNQYEWRTTPNTCVDASFSAPSNEYKPKVKVNQGIKLTNKTWMRKPVHHLGFACGPEKTKLMMQRY